MWRSRLFWKLFSAYASLILATTAVFAVLVAARQEEQVVSYLRERLHDSAVFLRNHVAAELAGGPSERLQAVAELLGRETQSRVTLVAADGTVWADSQQDPRVMENHATRYEIEQAAATGEGVAIQLSRTVGIPMMYLALRVDHAGETLGFVRVALAMESVEARITAMRRLVWGIAAAVGVATLVVTSWVVARITRPIGELTRAAESIAAGNYGHRVYMANRDELGLLGEAFNRMSAELNVRMGQISEDQHRLATVLGGMIEGVVAIDAGERVLFANDAARRLLSLPRDNLAGQPLWELVRHATVQQAVRDAFVSDQPCRREFEIAGPSRHVVALHAGRLPGHPSPGAVLVFHDVTELRRLESVRRDFVANVSHELKTPLASIKAYAETLLAGALDDRESNRSFVEQIEQQADRLHLLILDLISLARIESGQETFEIVPLDVAHIVASCVKQHDAAATAKQIALAVESPPNSVRALADEEGLHEILHNLLDNAVKYTPDGGRVTVRWRPADSSCVIEVQDSGIGIPPHEQARIFERFYRVDRARSRELGGTGLGLSIVKHLAQAFGGSVAVSSEVGRGSTFSVRLPLA
jgi:two-component system phosphate regulon sensor histidine kinase PhoR